jgi:hypothetical protein
MLECSGIGIPVVVKKEMRRDLNDAWAPPVRPDKFASIASEGSLISMDDERSENERIRAVEW